MKEVKTVIEIGTSKIACAMAVQRERVGLEVLGYVKVPYPGIKNRNWVQPKTVEDAVHQALDELEKQTGMRVRTVDLGLPACFTSLHMQAVSCGVNGRVSERDIDNLFDMASQFPRDEQQVIVTQFPNWYMLEDGEVFIDAYDKKTNVVSANITSVLANKLLMDDLFAVIRDAGVRVGARICEQLAHALALVPEEKRDTLAILADVGYYNTNISLVYGDAVLKTYTLEIGGGYITGDIAYRMKMHTETAEQLKRRYAFGLQDTNKIEYLFAKTKDGRLNKYPHNLLKEIIDSRTASIIKQIVMTVIKIERKLGKELPIYLTGGGISYMQGINSFFKTVSGRMPVVCRVNNTKMAEHSAQTMYALLDYSLNSSEDGILMDEEKTKKSGGFFSRLFNN